MKIPNITIQQLLEAEHLVIKLKMEPEMKRYIFGKEIQYILLI